MSGRLLRRIAGKMRGQRGMTLVETVIAFALLMLVIALFGSITLFAVNISFREAEASQTEILADTLITRIDETLRFAEIHDHDETQLRFTSTAFPRAGDEYATLRCDGSGQLVVRYRGDEYPLLPAEDYAGMTVRLAVTECQNGILKMKLTVREPKYGSRYSQEFSVLLANG